MLTPSLLLTFTPLLPHSLSGKDFDFGATPAGAAPEQPSSRFGQQAATAMPAMPSKSNASAFATTSLEDLWATPDTLLRPRGSQIGLQQQAQGIWGAGESLNSALPGVPLAQVLFVG